MRRLVLVGPVGVKVGPPDKLDIPDIFAMPQEQAEPAALPRCRQAPARPRNDVRRTRSPSMVRNRETLALITWEPYMHNPKLRHRLHRVRAPALFVRGESDGLVSAEYLAAYAALLPHARIETIARPDTRRRSSSPNGCRRCWSSSTRRTVCGEIATPISAWASPSAILPMPPRAARCRPTPEQRVPGADDESVAFQRERLSVSAAGRRIRIDPRQPAEPPLRPRQGRRALRPLPRRMADRRGRGHGDHAQRASPDGDLRRPGGAASCSARWRGCRRRRGS